MKNFFSRIRYNILALLAVVVSLVVSGCTMTADNTLGSDIMPEGQVMVMRHLKIRGSEVVRRDGYKRECAYRKKVSRNTPLSHRFAAFVQYQSWLYGSAS